MTHNYSVQSIIERLIDKKSIKSFHIACSLATPLITYTVLHIVGFNQAIVFTSVCINIGLIALLYSLYIMLEIMSKDVGTIEMQNICNAILQGSEGFFVAQYGTISKLSILFSIIIAIIYATKSNEHTQLFNNYALGVFQGASFLFGAFCSAFSGYAGMWISVRANVRVASAARRCYNDSIQIAFKGGYFAALVNIALAIIGIGIQFNVCYFLMYCKIGNAAFQQLDKIPLLIIGYGFGASFVAMFAQLGGGIYTKAADVGADLIGKVESDIPEDDERNPAVIADLVGDNVGDCAGQNADLFESITAEILSAMILGATMAKEAEFPQQAKIYFMLFPLIVHILDMSVSTIGMWNVFTKQGLPDYDASYGELEDPLAIMKRGYKISLGLGFVGFTFICYYYLSLLQNSRAWLYLAICGWIGSIVAYLFIEVTQYYTDYNHYPVKHIAYSSKTGHATNIIAGLSVGLESTTFPILIIVASTLTSYYLGEATGIADQHGVLIGGLYGTAIATMGMFSTGVFILSMSAYGPIADNAGGITEMSHQPDYVRKITDRLDAVGNVTKANAKGYSVGSASLACFLLFRAFIDEVNFSSKNKISVIDISQPEIFLSGMLGGAVVFLFSSWALSAVGNAAQDVIKEVRRQFREFPGILEYKVSPNYKQCVEIVTRAGLREMIKPGLLALLSPIVLGLLLKSLAMITHKELLAAKGICAFLMFSTCTGILMALFFNNAGGAWDNAKKYVESGALGGKGSETHKATVTGDTVGDPCKDTAGPSIHILIKLLSTITIVMVPIFID